MRIAFVVHDYNRTHGHSRYVAELAERFAGEHDVHVFANRFHMVPERITAHHVPAIRRSALLSIFSFVGPASILVGGDFDIVHAQGFSIRRPDVITAHICNARWLEGRRAVEHGRLPWRERLFGALVIPAERWAFGTGAAPIAVSRALRDDLRSRYGVTGDIDVIPHGVDTRQFHQGVRGQVRDDSRRRLGIDPGAVVHLFVGDLRKGFATAVRALGTGGGARLLAVSRTPPESYLALAKQAGVADRVTVLPPTDRIEQYYAAADVLVLPTPYDAFGMVITEAMACGLPVITTPRAGAAELMSPGVHGLLVDSPTDVSGFAQAMAALAGDADRRARMGAAAAALMAAHSWDNVAARTMEVYERRLAQKRADGA